MAKTVSILLEEKSINIPGTRFKLNLINLAGGVYIK
jgi:hypothetical protein